jgi:hypothetical protein
MKRSLETAINDRSSNHIADDFMKIPTANGRNIYVFLSPPGERNQKKKKKLPNAKNIKFY